MNDNEKTANYFWKAAEPILRKFIENIESPYVWTPLGLFILCILAYPISQFQPFLYLAFLFLLLAFMADWIGRWHNRKTPVRPTPGVMDYKEAIFNYQAEVQARSVNMMQKGKLSSARSLINENLKAVEEALNSFPNDPDFNALMGFTLKDVYQSSKNFLAPLQRQAYLNRAQSYFETALQLDQNNASAHNGMGNVLFFQGKFDEAIKEYDKAIILAGNNYPAAEHDRNLAYRVKSGEIKFDF